MTEAERGMVLYLINDGGADYCQKCIHLGKPSCGRYVSPTDYSGDCSIDYCIDGMVKFFEQQGDSEDNIVICEHCGKRIKKPKKCSCQIHRYADTGLTYDEKNLCPECWAELFERRKKADDTFYKECVYGK